MKKESVRVKEENQEQKHWGADPHQGRIHAFEPLVWPLLSTWRPAQIPRGASGKNRRQ